MGNGAEAADLEQRVADRRHDVLPARIAHPNRLVAPLVRVADQAPTERQRDGGAKGQQSAIGQLIEHFALLGTEFMHRNQSISHPAAAPRQLADLAHRFQKTKQREQRNQQRQRAEQRRGARIPSLGAQPEVQAHAAVGPGHQ